MTETLFRWEHAITRRVAELGGAADGEPLAALEAIDPTEAARFALRLMLVHEMLTLGPSDFALGDRKRAAHKTLLHGLPGLSLEELTDALVSGALWVDWAVAWEHHRFTFLSEHPALKTPESRLHVLRAAVAAKGWTGGGLVPWFLHRLIEDPVPSAGEWLFAAWQEHRKDARVEYMLAEAVIATGYRAGIEAIAATLDAAAPSHDAVSASIELDPATATERLGKYLAPERFAPGVARGASTRVLEALSSNGLRAGEISGFPSRRPRGWVRADPRWVPLLMVLRKERDPNVSHPARSALAHADPALVQASAPKPSKKTGKALELRAAGSAPCVTCEYWGDAPFTAPGRVALFSAPGRVEIRRVADGLPIEVAFDLPAGLELPTEKRSNNDDGWDRLGIHGVALHPSLSRIAVSSCANDEELGGVLLLDERGKIVARWAAEDLLPHRLQWGAGGTTLWVMAEGDGAVVVALDPETLEERGRCTIGAFPPPAFPSAFRHPTEDVACFQVLCGQDGFWVKCVERGPKGYKVRAQKLSAVHHDSVMWGISEDRVTVLTLFEAKLLLRDWPTMKPRKGKVLAGSARGAAASSTSVIVPVATVGHAADQFEVFRLLDGDKVGTGAWPQGHILQSMDEDWVLTTRGEELHVARVMAASRS